MLSMVNALHLHIYGSPWDNLRPISTVAKFHGHSDAAKYMIKKLLLCATPLRNWH